MIKSRAMRFSIFTLFLFLLISVYAPLCVSEVLLEDDFKKKDIDKGKWMPAATWSLDDEALDVNGKIRPMTRAA